MLEVVATSAGRVIDVAVEVGDNVAEGQTVARLAQPDLFDRLQAAKRRLQLMRRQQEQALAFLDGQDRLQRQALRQQRENLDKSIAAAEDDQRILAARVANQQELLKDGLITQSALLATRQQYEQQKERIRQARADQAQLQLRQVSLEDERAKMMRAGESDMQQAADEVARLEREFAFATEIVSPYTGRILEIMGEAGSIVGQGEPLLTLHLTGQSVQDLLAIIYVPAAFGKIIRPGMQIQVSPATVRKEEYGFMLGTVTFVSDYPATQKGMLRVLKNPQLIQALSGGGAPYEVHATLLVDPRTPSHYRWSSSSGPPMRIGSGTLAAAEVMVHEQRPIALVIPILRRWTGF